jgi:S1-C subfamily serine protease
MKLISIYRQLLAVIVSFAFLLSTSGCATIFSRNFQKVNINKTTQGATITYPEKGYRLKNGKHQFAKTKVYHTVTAKKEGYKDLKYSFQIDKRSPYLAFALLNLAVPYWGWFYGIPMDLRSPKTRKFAPEQKMPAMVAYENRKATEKYVLINNTSFDAKGKDIVWHNYLSIPRYENKDYKDTRSVKKHNKSKDREDLKIDNTIFTATLNGTMKKMNFIDTTKTIFPSAKNSIYLNATVRKITIHHIQGRVNRNVRQNAMYGPNTLMSIELTIDWEVLDYYKQKIDSVTTVKKSDLHTVQYAISGPDFTKDITDMLSDNLEYSMLDVRKALAKKGTLDIKNSANEPKEAPIALVKPVLAEGSKMNDFMKSGVTIKVDEGHGSGVILSTDGYIATAYHVIAGSKSIEIIYSSGAKGTAKVIRTNMESDLALLKVDTTGLMPLPMHNGEPELGVDVWAIGTPKTVELGQSLAKGILSGLRKANEITYLQTDASINGGNSGGALITKDGTIMGIVTAKLVGMGTEGLGFAISTQELFNRLNVVYK